VKNPTNEAFIKTWQTFTKNPKRVTNDPMEAHVIGFAMWVEAVKKAGTTDPDAVIDAIVGVSVPNLTGGYSAMMANHHITKPVLIGEIQANGQFDTVWQPSGLVVANGWSADLAGLVASLTTGGFGDRETAITALATSGEVRAAPILEALGAGQLYVRSSDKAVVIGKPDGNQLQLSDAITGKPAGIATEAEL